VPAYFAFQDSHNKTPLQFGVMQARTKCTRLVLVT
jgi:hypothetical protein